MHTPFDRGRADLCPGVQKPFSAEDGAIVRLRAPGGRICVDTLAKLLSLTPSGFVQLTSRGNLQLRALPEPVPEATLQAVVDAGLVPSTSHERVRNIVCSPLTGLHGGLVDMRPLVTALDQLLCADPLLADLPGRFLFVLDDGRGDVVCEPYDLAVIATSTHTAEVRQGGHETPVETPVEDAVWTVIELAREFQQRRTAIDPAPWHVRELNEPLSSSSTRLDGAIPGAEPVGALRPGPVGEHLVAGVPLGHLTGAVLDALARVSEEVVLTPWRSVVVPGGAAHADELHAAGLTTDPDDAWSGVSACTGRPGCQRSAIETLPLAREVVSALEHAPDRPIHISGCERRCGHPGREHHDLVAPASAAEVLAVVEQSQP